jgi:hypothetical protein
MRPAEIILRRGGGEIKKNERVNLTKTYCKHFCKCHSAPPAQQQYANKKKIRMCL